MKIKIIILMKYIGVLRDTARAPKPTSYSSGQKKTSAYTYTWEIYLTICNINIESSISNINIESFNDFD